MHRVVPELIVENYRAGNYRGEFPAVGMFLDLSGFSTMTDALMGHGQHGAEVLASLMQGVFDPLVESVFEYGGKIVGFAGDGVMALYPVESDARSTALQALASAYVIQNRLKEHPARQTTYGKFSVSAKIGLAIGSVSWGILHSSDDTQATYYFRGSAVDESSESEHQASAGDILLTRPIWQLLPADVEVSPCNSFQRFEKFLVELPRPSRSKFPPIDLDISRRFMPEDLIAHDMRGEFRQIVNLFMRFPDLTDQQLRDLMSKVFDLRSKYGGLLNRIDFGDKGCNLLLLWGAPVAYENDIARALNFLLDLKSQVDFPITSGVTYYIAHAGYLGSALCEDYTCYGWGINLASRFMMSATSGETWVDDRIARRVSRGFEIEFLGSQLFKGFAEAQKVHRLCGRKQTLDPIYQGELVGREKEMAQLAQFIEPLWQQRFAGLLLVSGDAGVGKGRLVYEFRSSKMFEGKKILWAICQSDQILRQSFNPLRNWLSKYFGISSQSTIETRKQSFDIKLDELIGSVTDAELVRELERTRSALGALLDLHWKGSLYEQLDPEGRYNNTFLALIALLKAESLRQPVVIFLEDLQFMDNDSKDFLPRLKRAILAAGESYPVAMIVTTRPSSALLEPELINVRIDLRGVSRAALARLSETILGGPAAPELVNVLLKRSEGNPYFVEQIIRYLQEENFLETSKRGWALVRRLKNDFLPADIRSLLVARLDQLAREVKECIQTASILGREFEILVLSEMLHEDQNVPVYVDEAEKAAIWAPLNEIRYIFSHGLLRDAAYEMQMQSRRQQLHRLAVEALESLYADGLTTRYAELAYHSERADLRSKARYYYTLAGKSAAEQYQNRQAIDYFTSALAFTPPEDLTAQFDILAERVELFNRRADRVSQFNDLDALDKLARRLGDHDRQAKMLMLRALYFYMLGNYLDAIDDASRAESLSEALAETDLAFLAQTTWVVALLRLGRLEEAMQRAQNTLQRVRKAGNRREEARVLNAMGLIALEQKDPATAEGLLVTALNIGRETKDRNMEAKALGNLAICETAVKGNYAVARLYYEQSHRIAREIGDRNAEGVALGNLGFTAGLQGDFVAAHHYYEQALSLAREAGNRYHETYTLINLSALSEMQNQGSLALRCAREAAELARKDGERSGEAWAWLYTGHAHLLLNHLHEAQAAYQRSVAIRTELGQPSLAMEPMAGLVDVALHMDEMEAAASAGEKILAHLASGGTLNGTDSPLRVYNTCHLFLNKQDDERSTQILQTAIQLLEAQLSKFKDEQTRKMYLENIPWCLALYQAAQALDLPVYGAPPIAGSPSVSSTVSSFTEPS
jgi:class 3 adenylate cyclase/tetratricopeptide (TPR) repeat protein